MSKAENECNLRRCNRKCWVCTEPAWTVLTYVLFVVSSTNPPPPTLLHTHTMTPTVLHTAAGAKYCRTMRGHRHESPQPTQCVTCPLVAGSGAITGNYVRSFPQHCRDSPEPIIRAEAKRLGPVCCCCHKPPTADITCPAVRAPAIQPDVKTFTLFCQILNVVLNTYNRINVTSSALRDIVGSQIHYFVAHLHVRVKCILNLDQFTIAWRVL